MSSVMYSQHPHIRAVTTLGFSAGVGRDHIDTSNSRRSSVIRPEMVDADGLEAHSATRSTIRIVSHGSTITAAPRRSHP